jgi:hypothetical protein
VCSGARARPFFKRSAEEREQVFSVDGPESSVAEVPGFDGGTYPAFAVWLTKRVLLFLNNQDFIGTAFGIPSREWNQKC